ncbi:hypothetical protein OXX79_000493 [Metschnikowia pulcherrima]
MQRQVSIKTLKSADLEKGVQYTEETPDLQSKIEDYGDQSPQEQGRRSDIGKNIIFGCFITAVILAILLVSLLCWNMLDSLFPS